MIQKWLYLGNHQSDLLQNLTQCSWGCALPLGVIIFMAMMSRGAYRCMKHIQGVFLVEKQGKIQPGAFPEVSPGCPMSSITVIQYFLPFHVRTMFIENKSSLRGTSLHQWLPP